LGIGKRPDYLLRHGDQACVCEVKEFARTTDSIPSRASSMQTVLKPIRTQLHEAARKLRAAIPLGHPLVVVLTNPHGAGVLLGGREMVWAMEGDPQVRFAVSPSGAAGPLSHTVGLNGEFRNDHPYVSAVVVVHRLLQGDHCAQTYLPKLADAASLSEVFFRAPSDQVFEFQPERQAYEQVHG
jgi:hypothetical protein